MDEFGGDVAKWSIFICKQIFVITMIILANWGVFTMKSLL